jgi:ferredoxin-NADP reductase
VSGAIREIDRIVAWRPAEIREVIRETSSAATLLLDVEGWPGHRAGQHIDVRLTAEDGYTAQRSYSIASAPEDGVPAITVERLDDGEVSPYLVDDARAGDMVEIRGPVGGWFVWRPTQSAPVLLVAGGSGIVPLMAMIRARGAVRARQPFRLVYSVRTPSDACFATELARRVRDDPGLDVRYVYTRQTPPDWPEPAKRISVAVLNTYGWPPDFAPDCFVCGPTGFVETAADILVALGHDPRKIKTERFGGTS